MAEGFISRVEVSESGFVFDPRTGSTFTLNHTGLKILRLLREGRSRDEIIGDFARDYGIEAGEAQRDVDDFVVAVKSFDAK